MFKAILADLLARVKGARWAMVVGVDGVMLEATPTHNHTSAEVLAAEYAVFFRACQKVISETRAGEFQSLVFFTTHGKVMFEFLTAEYFFLMGLDPEGHTGRARFEISRARSQLERELVL